MSTSYSALISGVTAMVVYVHERNFSTTDSSLFRSSVSTDDALWDSTAPQSPGELSRTGHTVVAVCLGFILVAGILSNFLTLLVFAKFRSLWTPINLILLNISLSDILVCVFGTPFSFAASLHGRWLIGEYGCKWYGFANSLFGIVSLVSLSLLSYERYTTVLHLSQVDISDFRKAWLCVGGSWFYSLFWTLPPLLGWSSYGPVGPGTTCSIQWHLHSPASISYLLCLFTFCLLLPLLLMLYSYGRILVAIKRGNRFSTEGKDGSPSSEKQKMDKQDTFYKPSARMAVQKAEKPNSSGYLQWDTRHSVLRVINYYEQSWLTIPQDGDYYIYSRVTFSKEHSVKPLASQVKLRKHAADKDVKDIMKAYCYLSSTKNPHMCTASQGDVITLEKGNQLGLWVQDLSLVDYEEGATVFGIYKL